MFSLLKDAGEAKLLFDSAGIIAFASGALSHLVGTEATDATGRRAAELPASWGPAISAIAHQAFVQKQPVANDVSIVHPSGQTIRLSVRATPMIENGEILGVGIAVNDAASRRVIDTATRGDLAAALAATAFSPFVTVFLDARGTCIAAGGPVARVTGLDPESAKGQGWMRIVSAQSIEAFRQAAIAAQRTGDGWRIGFEHANGRASFECAAGAVLDPSRNVVGYVAFVVDRSMLTSSDNTGPSDSASPAPKPSDRRAHV